MWPALVKQGTSHKAEVSDFTCMVPGINILYMHSTWQNVNTNDIFTNKGVHRIVVVHSLVIHFTIVHPIAKVNIIYWKGVPQHLDRKALIALDKNNMHCWFLLNGPLVAATCSLVCQSRSNIQTYFSILITWLDFCYGLRHKNNSGVLLPSWYSLLFPSQTTQWSLKVHVQFFPCVVFYFILRHINQSLIAYFEWNSSSSFHTNRKNVYYPVP